MQYLETCVDRFRYNLQDTLGGCDNICFYENGIHWFVKQVTTTKLLFVATDNTTSSQAVSCDMSCRLNNAITSKLVFSPL